MVRRVHYYGRMYYCYDGRSYVQMKTDIANTCPTCQTTLPVGSPYRQSPMIVNKRRATTRETISIFASALLYRAKMFRPLAPIANLLVNIVIGFGAFAIGLGAFWLAFYGMSWFGHFLDRHILHIGIPYDWQAGPGPCLAWCIGIFSTMVLCCAIPLGKKIRKEVAFKLKYRRNG